MNPLIKKLSMAEGYLKGYLNVDTSLVEALRQCRQWLLLAVQRKKYHLSQDKGSAMMEGLLIVLQTS